MYHTVQISDSMTCAELLEEFSLDEFNAVVASEQTAWCSIRTNMYKDESCDPVSFYNAISKGAVDYEAFLKTGDPDFAWKPPKDEWQSIALGDETCEPVSLYNAISKGAVDYEAFLQTGDPDFAWKPQKDEGQSIVFVTPKQSLNSAGEAALAKYNEVLSVKLPGYWVPKFTHSIAHAPTELTVQLASRRATSHNSTTSNTLIKVNHARCDDLLIPIHVDVKNEGDLDGSSCSAGLLNSTSVFFSVFCSSEANGGL
ncbi:hypothetical protein J5N97_018361 [Dioscorea zingiberensis]|uniref:Uncharacterized protein n=1 Tax=Dioscorea zingiberensis TaxID=325984 RepID=A0A9D5HH57_9LILI|nr:hypothetical protein J5N97_018361 [Dioscorea zingiberensis]